MLARPLACALLLLAASPLPAAADPQDPAAPTAPASPPGPVVASPATPPSPLPPAVLPTFSVGGGALLWLYLPTQSGAQADFSLYVAYLTLDAKLDALTFHVEPRLRIDKLRSYFPSVAWVQEVYVSGGGPRATLKVGKVYSHLGRFWDDSFYGNLLYFDGLKLDPEFGASLEGKLGGDGRATLGYDAQLFLVDGRTNGSLPLRDTLSYPGARKRNHGLLRLEPGLALGSKAAVTLGATLDASQSDFGGGDPEQVWRVEGDLTAHLGPVTAFGEVLHQSGYSVRAYPSPTSASNDNLYVWAGLAAELGPVTARYNFSMVRYQESQITEVMHQPGLSFRANRFVSVLAELALWSRETVTLDRSVNLVLDAHF